MTSDSISVYEPSATIPVLPPAYVALFKKLYDQAPSHDFEACTIGSIQ